MSDRKLTGSIQHGDRVYGPGDEVAFAAAMGDKPLGHLVDRGLLTGDWGANARPTAPHIVPNTATGSGAARSGPPGNTTPPIPPGTGVPAVAVTP